MVWYLFSFPFCTNRLRRARVFEEPPLRTRKYEGGKRSRGHALRFVSSHLVNNELTHKKNDHRQCRNFQSTVWWCWLKDVLFGDARRFVVFLVPVRKFCEGRLDAWNVPGLRIDGVHESPARRTYEEEAASRSRARRTEGEQTDGPTGASCTMFSF